MRERLILLEAKFRGDLEVIDELYSALGSSAPGSDALEERLIVNAYRGPAPVRWTVDGLGW